MIRLGSTFVSEAIQVVVSDGADAIQPVDLTGMTIAALFWDVGHIGAAGGWPYTIYDYGLYRDGTTPLLTLTMDEGGVVVDDAENGVLHLYGTPANSRSLFTTALGVPMQAQRRLTRQIWRTDTGLEALLQESVEWCRA